MNKIDSLGTSLAVQWLRLLPSSAGGVSSVPSQGTKIPPPGPPAAARKKKKKAEKRNKMSSPAFLGLIV